MPTHLSCWRCVASLNYVVLLLQGKQQTWCWVSLRVTLRSKEYPQGILECRQTIVFSSETLLSRVLAKSCSFWFRGKDFQISLLFPLESSIIFCSSEALCRAVEVSEAGLRWHTRMLSWKHFLSKMLRLLEGLRSRSSSTTEGLTGWTHSKPTLP